jgi:hypothetical protein
MSRFFLSMARALVATVFCTSVSLFFSCAFAQMLETTTADGARYSGATKDGKRHGAGRLEWPNGAVYEGEFLNGLMHGRGRMKHGSGDVYVGEFRNGMAHGAGRSELIDGSVYAGEFARDYYNGRGRFAYVEGSVYEGMFKNGLQHGAGRFTEKGLTQEGEYKLGQLNGKGVETAKDRGTYRGEFRRGRYHGKGRYEGSDGDVFEGDFAEGEFTGAGTLKRKDGTKHVGQFAKWRSEGKGVYDDALGTTYEGKFVDGVPDGIVIMKSKSGARYEGPIKDWRMHGDGVYKSADGDVYKGTFFYGMYEGQGTFTFARPRADGATSQTGMWRAGRLVDDKAEEAAKRSAETALYNQQKLLDAAKANLAPRIAGKINMYSLLVAGDGSQEVFRREVDFVRAQFSEKFDLGPHTIALINSRNTIDKAPMATITSIGESLDAIAAKMDKEQDILFLFLTSHGSKEHEFTLAQNNIQLNDLTNKKLGELLKRSGIRWKVVVVSACYGGGFIDPVKDDTTLIITAARHDRRSFGCADENDFTYFGRAFFKESLPKSRSFQDAFRSAEKLIKQWEAKEIAKSDEPKKANDEDYSIPQMVSTRAIEQHLAKWWAQRK